MPKTLTVLRVFVASPGDVDEERAILESAINLLNQTLPEQHGVLLRLVKWETDAYPGISTDAQSVINSQIGDDYDIFLGILWARFGTPTGRAASGTAEEFEKAYARWVKSPDSVSIMFYFKNSPISPSKIDTDQLAKVQAFRKDLSTQKGTLYWEFDSPGNFRDFILVHLTRQVMEWKKKLEQGSLNVDKPIATPPIVEEVARAVTSAVAQDEPEGFIDLIESIVASTSRGTEAVAHMMQAVESLNAGVNEASLELANVQGNELAKLEIYKKASNKVGHLMESFVTRMNVENPIMAESIDKSLTAYAGAVRIFPEFGASSSNIDMLLQLSDALGKLNESMRGSKRGMLTMRDATAKLPRVTNYFSKARRSMLVALDEYMAIIDRAGNIIPEIQQSIRTIIDDMNKDAARP